VVVDGDQVLVIKRHTRGRHYTVPPGGGIEEARPHPRPCCASCTRRPLPSQTEIDRLLWTGRHNDPPAWYFLMTAVRGRAELSGSKALANRPDNSFGLRWVTADQLADLGLHPPEIRGPLAELLAGRGIRV
jgi:hypothetical protein